jgi:V8-like Glu-specific endopeptidase
MGQRQGAWSVLVAALFLGCADPTPVNPRVKAAVDPARMPEEITDATGMRWIKRRPGAARAALIGGVDVGDSFNQISLETAAHMFRPVTHFQGVEYQVSWEEALALAEQMRAAAAQGTAGGGLPAPSSNIADDIPAQNVQQPTGDNPQNLWATASMPPANNVANMVGGDKKCTCFKMINDHTCVTAGHCVYRDSFFDSEIQFAAGGVGNRPSTLVSGCYQAIVPGCWCDGNNSYCDYAVLRLRHPDGVNCNLADYNVGYLAWNEIPAPAPGTTTPFTATLVGYPGQPPMGWGYPSLVEWRGSGSVSPTDRYMFYFTMPGDEGSSGGPVLRNWSVSGIYKGTRGGTNWGVRMTRSLARWLSNYGGR